MADEFELCKTSLLGSIIITGFSHHINQGSTSGHPYGFYKVVYGSECKTLSNSVLLLISAHDNDRNVFESFVFFHVREHLESIHLGHEQIQQHKIKLVHLIVESLHGLLSVFYCLCLKIT